MIEAFFPFALHQPLQKGRPHQVAHGAAQVRSGNIQLPVCWEASLQGPLAKHGGPPDGIRTSIAREFPFDICRVALDDPGRRLPGQGAEARWQQPPEQTLVRISRGHRQVRQMPILVHGQDLSPPAMLSETRRRRRRGWPEKHDRTLQQRDRKSVGHVRGILDHDGDARGRRVLDEQIDGCRVRFHPLRHGEHPRPHVGRIVNTESRGLDRFPGAGRPR